MKNYAKITPEGTRDLLFEECDARRMVERHFLSCLNQEDIKVITPHLNF